MNVYKCPECKTTNFSGKWDVATSIKYGTDDLVSISDKESESASFVCPDCLVESDGKDITTVEYGVLAEMTVKIRKVRPHSVIPTYGTAGAACFDLYAAEDVIIGPGETAAVPVGFAVELPDNYEMQIRPRSGISLKTKLRIANAPGTVDEDFRSEVAVVIDNISRDSWSNAARRLDNTYDDETRNECAPGSYIIRRGDRIAQAAVVPVPRVSFVEVDEELTQTERGDGGFGSTGVN